MPATAQAVPASTLGTLYTANTQLLQVNQALTALRGGALITSIGYGTPPTTVSFSPPASDPIYATLIADLTALQTSLTAQLTTAGVTVGA